MDVEIENLEIKAGTVEETQPLNSLYPEWAEAELDKKIEELVEKILRRLLRP